MPKNIVLCSDGTGNIANKNRGTNVFKLFEALDTSTCPPAGARRQVVFYDDGVGTERARWLRLLTGAVGWGLSRNVRQLYRHLCRSYEPGDSIYLFGFSRGAFTARTLAGLIVDCGVIDMDKPVPARGFGPFRVLPFTPGGPLWLRWLSWRALRTHRRHYVAFFQGVVNFVLRLKQGERAVADFRRRYSTEARTKKPVRIHFLGVWDTVNSVGVPSEGLRRIIGSIFYRYTFPKTTLSDRVEKACHALSLDDERQSFAPVLWDESLYPKVEPCECGGERSDEDDGGSRIEQVWFPGMHADVGGGYAKHGLAHVPLRWMMRRAEAHGLRFTPMASATIRERRNPLGTMHDSRAGAGRYYRYLPRDVEELCAAANAKCRVHAAAFDRLLARTDDYLPVCLPAGYEIVDDDVPDPKLEGVRAAAADSCMRPMRFSVWTRRLAHLAFVGLTAFVGWLGWVGGARLDDVRSMDAMAVLQALASSRDAYPLGLPGVAVGGLVIWIASAIAKSRIREERRRYWMAAVGSGSAQGSPSVPGRGGVATGDRGSAE